MDVWQTGYTSQLMLPQAHVQGKRQQAEWSWTSWKIPKCLPKVSKIRCLCPRTTERQFCPIVSEKLTRLQITLLWNKCTVTFFTDHVRSTREDNVFPDICDSVQGEGEGTSCPTPAHGRLCPVLVLSRGYPEQRSGPLGREVPWTEVWLGRREGGTVTRWPIPTTPSSIPAS